MGEAGVLWGGRGGAHSGGRVPRPGDSLRRAWAGQGLATGWPGLACGGAPRKADRRVDQAGGSQLFGRASIHLWIGVGHPERRGRRRRPQPEAKLRRGRQRARRVSGRVWAAEAGHGIINTAHALQPYGRRRPPGLRTPSALSCSTGLQLAASGGPTCCQGPQSWQSVPRSHSTTRGAVVSSSRAGRPSSHTPLRASAHVSEQTLSSAGGCCSHGSWRSACASRAACRASALCCASALLLAPCCCFSSASRLRASASVWLGGG